MSSAKRCSLYKLILTYEDIEIEKNAITTPNRNGLIHHMTFYDINYSKQSQS